MSAGFALLPSQEALLQRLHLNASYTRQLQVVIGGTGAGKTTLVTALVDELEGYNSALVICPEHADSAEIRRKILIQLTSSLIFDDEHPLAETLLRLSTDLKQPLHIIIDDAHLLPLTLWAECLVLSQLECGGKPISLTLTAPAEFMTGLSEQMTIEQRGMMLSVPMGVLPLTERETLFQFLLARVGDSVFLPASIISEQLTHQHGTPAEVVELFERALNPPESNQRSSLWLWGTVGICSTLIIVLLVGLYLNYSSHNTNNNAARINFLPEQLTLLAHRYTFAREKVFGLMGNNYVEIPVSQNNKSQKVVPPLRIESDKRLIQMGLEGTNHILSEQRTSVAADLTSPVKDKPMTVKPHVYDADRVKVNHPNAQIINTNNVNIVQKQRNRQSLETLPTSGFGIQLTSVEHIKSLKQVLADLEGIPQLTVLQGQGRWLVIQGQYSSRLQAVKAVSKLSLTYQLGTPWVRRWGELQYYRLYQP